MYHSISEFLLDWKQEKEFTQKVLNNITDDSLNYSSGNTGRNIGRLAWHIVTSISEMGKSGGLKFEAALPDPESANAMSVKEAYKRMASNIQSAVSSQWSDDDLSEKLNMYGEMWKKSFILEVLIKHQIHHRGQLTMLMRQAGLKVPGVYGPSYEEWQSMGMVPQE